MKGSYYMYHHHHNRDAAPAAADALEDGLSPLLQPAKPQHQPLYYDDDKRKGHRRRGRRHGRSSSSPVAVVLSFVLLAAAACLLVWRARAGVGVGGEGGATDRVTRAKKAAVESFNVKTLVQQGIEEGQKGPKQEQPPQRQDQAVGTWILL
jgi:hypothetical protein